MAAPLMLRKALLILDCQNEFLAPTGRCKVNNPSVAESIKKFAQAFRQNGHGDIIWIKSEFSKPRDVDDPRIDEKIVLYEKEDDENPEQADSSAKAKKGKKSKKDEMSTPPIDEFLSSAVNPCVAKGSQSAEFHESICAETVSHGDRVLTKTWYSAFKGSSLIEILRGRLITELYICGLTTNVSVLATVADAVRHGFAVVVLSDCLGYSDQKLHEVALAEMTGELGVEVIRSMTMVKSWAAKKRPSGKPSATAPKTASKEELAELIANLTLSGPVENDDSIAQSGGTADDEYEEGGVKSALQRAQASSQKKADSQTSQKQQSIGESTSRTMSLASEASRPRKKHPIPIVLKEGDVMGEGDTRLVNNILPQELAQVAFENMKKEVRWRTMHHRGGEVPRLVAVEGEIDKDGSFPIYRHPADESPPLRSFSPTVSLIREHVQKVLKHPVNHVLIQYYRDGNDYISEHSDKTLDIVRGSYIVNVSLGAQRTMILRTKKGSKEWTENKSKLASDDRDPRLDGKPGLARTSQRIPLPHNSMFILGDATNRKWLHAIKQDKRLQSLKSPAETLYQGERISLTFRHIGTFLSDNETRIWGQGATSKKKEDAKSVIENDEKEVERMIFAFGTENHQAEEFDWDAVYGGGFDVLHFRTRLPKLWYSKQQSVGVIRVLLSLSEKQIDVEVEARPLDHGKDGQDVEDSNNDDDVCFVDSDVDRTTTRGSIPILLYLETFYSGDKALGGVGKSLFPQPQRHERGQYADVVKMLLESEKLLRAVCKMMKERKLVQAAAGAGAGAGAGAATTTPVINPPAPTHDTTPKSTSAEEASTTTTTADKESPGPTKSEKGKESVTAGDGEFKVWKLTEATTNVFPQSIPVPVPSFFAVMEGLTVAENQLHKLSFGISSDVIKPSPLSEEDNSPYNLWLGGYGFWSVADCAFWPVLWLLDQVKKQGTGSPELEKFECDADSHAMILLKRVRKYYTAAREREEVKRVFVESTEVGADMNTAAEEKGTTKPQPAQGDGVKGDMDKLRAVGTGLNKGKEDEKQKKEAEKGQQQEVVEPPKDGSAKNTQGEANTQNPSGGPEGSLQNP